MAIVTRVGKGSKLTAKEMDNNLLSLESDISGNVSAITSKLDKGTYTGTAKDLENAIAANVTLIASKLDKGAYTGTAKDLENAIVAAVTGASGISIVPTSPAPSGTGIASFTATQAGTYTNYGGVVVNTNSFAVISRSAAGVFSISQTAFDLTTYVKTIDLNAYAVKQNTYELIGEPTLTSYSKDFTPLTLTTSNSTSIWFNNAPLTTRGRLKTMRVKVPVGSVVTSYVYSITGASGSLVFTLLKTYSTFTTTTLEHTQSIVDNFIIEAGQYIGFKSSLGIYYTTSGSATNNVNNSWLAQTYGMDFIINTNLVLGIKDNIVTIDAKVLTVETNQGKNTTDISGLTAAIATPLIINYPIDFSVLTTLGGANNKYITLTPVTKRGRLTSFRIKTTIGSVVTPYAFSVTGASGSFVYTILNTFPSFTTTTLEFTQAITDTYIVEAGQYIGFKSTLNFYFKSGGGLSADTAQPSASNLIIGYDFKINETILAGLTDRVVILEITKNANDTVIADISTNLALPILKVWTQDFSVLTLNSGANRGYAQVNRQVTKRSRLTAIRTKAPIGATVSVVEITVTGTNGSLVITEGHLFDTFVTTELITTRNITDSYIVEVGKFIGYKTSGGIYFNTIAPAQSIVGVTESSYGAFTGIGFDFTLDEELREGLNFRVSALELNKGSNNSAITDLQTNAIKNVILKPSILYRNVLSSIADFTTVNWSLANGGGAEPTGIGSANHFWLKKRYHVNPRTLSINVNLLADSVFYIECAPLDYAQNNGFFIIDVPNNTISINGANSGTPVQKAIGTVNFTFVSGRKYVIDATILNFNNNLSIKDVVTGETFSISYMPPTSLGIQENTQADSYKFYLNNGTTAGVKINSITISSKLKPLVLLIGDSITAGVSLPTSGETGRYGRLLEAKLKGNVLISARGGAVLNDVTNKLETELAFIKPDYCMLTMGTNFSGFSQITLTIIVNRIIELGSVPIINHVPNRADGSHINTNNIIDATCLATGAIRGALFDVATSISNNPANSYIVADYFDTGVHPNVSGQLKMYNRFEIDLPFLFS
jgi:hypothetical protein